MEKRWSENGELGEWSEIRPTIGAHRIDWHDSDGVTLSGDGSERRMNCGENRPSRKKKDRLKFTCHSCGMNAWAKPTAKLTCTNCIQPLCPNVQPKSVESRAIMCPANQIIAESEIDFRCPACSMPWVDEDDNFSICRRCPHRIPPRPDAVEREQQRAQPQEDTWKEYEDKRSEPSYFDFLMTV